MCCCESGCGRSVFLVLRTNYSLHPILPTSSCQLWERQEPPPEEGKTMFNMMDTMRITWTMMTMQRMLMIFEGEQIVLLFSLNRRFLILTSTTSEPLRPPTITTESCCPLSKILSITILSPAMFKGTRSRKKRLSFSQHFPAGHHEGCKQELVSCCLCDCKTFWRGLLVRFVRLSAGQCC